MSEAKYPHVFLVRLDDERMRRLEAIRAHAGIPIKGNGDRWRGDAARFAIDCCYDLFVSTKSRTVPPSE